MRPALVAAAAAISASLVRADRTSFDCPMRQLLVEYAAQVQPGITAAALQDIADALNGAPPPRRTPADDADDVVAPPHRSQATRRRRPTAR